MKFQRKLTRANSQQMKKSALRKIKDFHAYQVLHQAKVQEIMAEFKKDWVDEVNMCVPRFCKIASLWFPPKVYSRVFFTLWRRDWFLRYINDIAVKPWPAWRKWLNKVPVAAVFNAVKFVGHDWLLYCFRYPLRTWGVRKVIYRSGPTKYTMDIYYWREKVYSKTREVKV